MNKCRLASLIRLSYLAPDIVRALLEGRQPIELTPTRLLRLSKDLPGAWDIVAKFIPGILRLVLHARRTRAEPWPGATRRFLVSSLSLSLPTKASQM